ncbi:hypothetical protein HK097_009758, partial [Rhizophlyctis rosea]
MIDAQPPVNPRSPENLRDPTTTPSSPPISSILAYDNPEYASGTSENSKYRFVMGDPNLSSIQDINMEFFDDMSLRDTLGDLDSFQLRDEAPPDHFDHHEQTTPDSVYHSAQHHTDVLNQSRQPPEPSPAIHDVDATPRPNRSHPHSETTYPSTPGASSVARSTSRTMQDVRYALEHHERAIYGFQQSMNDFDRSRIARLSPVRGGARSFRTSAQEGGDFDKNVGSDSAIHSLHEEYLHGEDVLFGNESNSNRHASDQLASLDITPPSQRGVSTIDQLENAFRNSSAAPTTDVRAMVEDMVNARLTTAIQQLRLDLRADILTTPRRTSPSHSSTTRDHEMDHILSLLHSAADEDKSSISLNARISEHPIADMVEQLVRITRDLESRLNEKADAESVNDSINTLESRLESVKAESNAASDRLIADVARLSSRLDRKADQDAITAFQNQYTETQNMMTRLISRIESVERTQEDLINDLVNGNILIQKRLNALDPSVPPSEISDFNPKHSDDPPPFAAMEMEQRVSQLEARLDRV